jgi:hypothetical protein
MRSLFGDSDDTAGNLYRARGADMRIRTLEPALARAAVWALAG